MTEEDDLYYEDWAVELDEQERKRQEFKEKLAYWRENGNPITIPNSFRA